MGVYQWYTPNLFTLICRTLLHQSIENNNVELKIKAKCIRQRKLREVDGETIQETHRDRARLEISYQY